MTRLLFIHMVIFLTAASVSAASYTIPRNEWFHIPVAVPQAKVGGGDFYILEFSPTTAASPVEYEVLKDGVRVRSDSPGSYDFMTVINHVSKSSCAGVEVNQHSSDTVRLMVPDK